MPDETPLKPNRLPSFSSMAECVAQTGIPLHVLKQAKRAGCDAFDSHNRVNLRKLLVFLFKEGEDGDEGGTDWNLRAKRAKALLDEMELKEREGKMRNVDDMRSEWDRCAAKACAVMTQKFVTELPPRCDGNPAAEIAKKNEEAVEQVREILSNPETYK